MQVNLIETEKSEVIMLLSKKEALLIMKLVEVEYGNYYESKTLKKLKVITRGTEKEIEMRQNIWDLIHSEVYC